MVASLSLTLLLRAARVINFKHVFFLPIAYILQIFEAVLINVIFEGARIWFEANLSKCANKVQANLRNRGGQRETGRRRETGEGDRRR